MAKMTEFEMQPQNAVTILVDARGLMYDASLYAQKLYPNANGKEREGTVIFCLFERLMHVSRRFHTNKLVFAWESHKSKRKELYPGYKDKRSIDIQPDDSPEEIERKKKRIEANAYAIGLWPFWEKIEKEIIPALGFKNCFSVDGFEGDDIIASIVKSNPRRYFVIFSADNDFYQLINKRCAQLSSQVRRIVDGIPKAPVVLDRGAFVAKYGIEPEQWVQVKELAGCPCDGVPGLAGVGRETALKYLKEGRMLLKSGKPSARQLAIDNGDEVIKLTRRLTELPFEGTPEIKLNVDELQYTEWQKLCQTYGLSTLAASEFWNSFFNE